MRRVGWLVGALAWALPVVAQSERVETPIAPGVTYLQVTRPGPVQVHVLKVDLSEAATSAEVALGGRSVLELHPLSEIVARPREGRKLVGAINGGYALLRADPYQGSPIGLLIADGELICDPWPTPRSALVLAHGQRPRIEQVSLNGKATGADGHSYRLGGLNRRRMPGEMVLYSPRFNPATRVLEAGRQVVLTGVFTDGAKLTCGVTYSGTVAASVDGLVNVEIPADGVVLAGSGPAGAWLAERKLGERVTFEFALQPELGAVTSALGAGPRLVRDGKVSIEAEAERIGVALTTGTQPRSAVGFNDVFLYLVAVDGRAAGYSIGMTMEQLAQFMVELGCTQAMALDGGGSTTLFVRDRVVNRPSDGVERAIADALLLTTTGALTNAPLPNPTVNAGGTAPMPTEDFEPPTEVRPPAAPVARISLAPGEVSLSAGQSVQLIVAGESATGEPAPIDPTKIEYAVTPPLLGEVDDNGRFTAAKPGIGRISARYGEQVATVVVKVTATAAELPPIVPPTTPGDEPGVAPTQPPAGPQPAEDTGPEPPRPVRPRPKPEIPDGERKLIDGFESDLHWKPRVYPEGIPGNVSIVANPRFQGNASCKLRYDFTTTDATRAVYAIYRFPIGTPKAVSVWVFGDGGGHWLRGRYRDKFDQVHYVDFAEEVNWDHYWARCTAVLPPDVKGPIIWDEIYLVEHRPEVKGAGAIYLDQFEGIY